jgi:hypothetical protein
MNVPDVEKLPVPGYPKLVDVIRFVATRDVTIAPGPIYVNASFPALIASIAAIAPNEPLNTVNAVCAFVPDVAIALACAAAEPDETEPLTPF